MLTLCPVLVVLFCAPELSGEEPVPPTREEAFPSFSAAMTSAGDETIGVRYRYWLAGIDGKFTASDTGVPGTNIDVESDLDLGEEAVPELGAWLHIPFLGHFRGTWWKGEFEGSETLTANVTFSGTTFTTGTPVNSTIDLDIATVVWDIGLISPEIAGTGFELALQIGAKYMVAGAEIESSALTANEKVRGGVPVVGARFAVHLTDSFNIEAEASGLAVDRSGIEITFVDASLEATYDIIGGVYFGAGYRLVQLLAKDDDATRSDVEIDISIEGFTATVGWRF